MMNGAGGKGEEISNVSELQADGGQELIECGVPAVPDTLDPNVMPLAWFCFSQSAFPTTTVTFNWTLDWTFDYQSMWDETGTLKPGVGFHVSQVWNADRSGDRDQIGSIARQAIEEHLRKQTGHAWPERRGKSRR